MRNIFSLPQQVTPTATHFQWLLNMNDGLLTEKDLATSLRISKRDVRKIAENFNYRKYINQDNSVKYQVIEKKYHIIVKDHKERDYVVNKRLFAMIKEMKAYKIYIEDLGGDKNQLQMTIDQLMKDYEQIDNIIE